MSSVIDVAFITETWLHPNTVSDAELSCDGRFQVFRCDRLHRGGGVLTLVSSEVTCYPINIDKDDDIELVAVELLLNDVRVRCVCVYFSPSGSTEALLDRMTRLSSLLETICEHDVCTYIVGDFNLPQID